MKIIACIFLSTISLSSLQAIRFSAVYEIGTGDARISLWKTDYGSYDRDLSRSNRHSPQPLPQAASLRATVYFIAKPTIAPGAQGYDPRALFIYDRSEHADEFHNELELAGTFIRASHS